MRIRYLVWLLAVVVLTFGLSLTVQAQDRPDLLIWADNTRSPALQPLADQFSNDFGVTVQVQEIGMGDIRSNLPVAGPAGEGPDILIATSDWLGELVQNGSVLPIDLGDHASEFTDTSLKLFTYDGKLYAMPYAIENLAFFRNTDLVPDAPKTWDEVKTITKDLVDSKKSQYGYMIQSADSYHYFPIENAFGGYLFSVDDKGAYNYNDVGLDNDGSLAAAEWLDGMVKAGYIPPAVDYDVMHNMFETGQAAMMMTGPWALPRIRQSGVHYAISNIPAGPAGAGQPFLGGQGFMISAFSQNQLLAESFLLDFMAAKDPMKAMYDVDPRPPAFQPLRESLEDPDLVAFDAAGKDSIYPLPAAPGMTSVWGAWGNAVNFVVTQQVAPDQAFKDAATQIRDLISNGGQAPVTAGPAVGDTPPADGPQNVSIPGTLQSKVGCPGDWAPDCADTQLAYNANSDVWMGTFALPAGDYEYKVALNNAWDENYGGMADKDGPNVKLSLAEDSNVTFVYDNKTHWVADSVNKVIATVPGSFQSKIGCSADWAPDCLRSWLEDPDGDGVYTFETTAIPAGDYEAKVAVNMSWDLNYGENGEKDGANLKFNVASDGTPVTFSFDSTSNILTISSGS